VSIVFMSALGAVPTNAGRNSGSVGRGDGDGEPGFAVCAETRAALSHNPIKQKIRSRMAE